MSHTRLDAFDHALHTAHTWVSDVAKEFGTEDRRFAYRVLRAWLHTLRDRLPVEGAAQFAAQLPELLRGVFYDGWEPARVPVKYGPDEYVLRFAEEARLPLADVRRAAATVTYVVGGHLSPGQLSEALAQLPGGLRSLLLGSGSPEQPGEQGAAAAREAGHTARREAGHTARLEAGHTASEATAPEEAVPARFQRLEAQVASLAEAVSVLARGLEKTPGEEPDEQRSAKAARLAHEILLAAGR